MTAYLKKILLALLVLLIANILSLYPFSFRLKDSSPDNPDDVLLNSYIMVWEYEHILNLDLENYFNTNYYYPYKNTLAFTEHHSLNQLFFIPLYTLIKDPLLVHNIIILLALVLNGLVTFVFIHYLTGSFMASIVGAVLFSFVPYRYTHLVHINVIHWWTIPLAFLSFYIFAVRVNFVSALFLGLSILFVFYSSNNMAAFFLVPFGIYAILQIVWNRSYLKKGFYLYSLFVISFVFVCIIPVIMPYLRLRDEMFFERFLYDIRYFSPQLINFLGVHKSNILWGSLLGGNGKWECFLFPGVSFIALFLLSLTGIFFGRYRRYILLFLSLSLISFLLSLGPYINGLKGDIIGPYYLLLKYIPGYYGIRVPTRFAIFMYFGMSVSSSLFIAELLFRFSSNKRIIFSSILLLLTLFIILEGSHRIEPQIPLNHPERDALYSYLKGLPDGVLFECPAFIKNRDAYHVFSTLYHKKVTTNGYSGWNSKVLENLKDAVKNYSPAALVDMMRDLNIRYFILRDITAPSIYEKVSKIDRYSPYVKKLYENDGDILFEIEGSRLNLFDLDKEGFENARFYFPSCVKQGKMINGGVIFPDKSRFLFSYRRRYSSVLKFVDRISKDKYRVDADFVAYRVYEPGYVHLLVKFRSDLREGTYSILFNDRMIKEDIRVSNSCPDEISQMVDIVDVRVPEMVNEKEMPFVSFRLINKEKYIKSAVDIDDFTTDGVFRVVIFIEGIDQDNEDIRYEQRYPVYSDLSSQDSIDFRTNIPFYFKRGRYKLRIDCVSEKRFWYSYKGSCNIEKVMYINW